jgi:hypothetical protein
MPPLDPPYYPNRYLEFIYLSIYLFIYL